MTFLEQIKEARSRGDLSPIVRAIPYCAFMGIEARVVDEDILGFMPFSDRLVGNATVHALHGGTLGALMESTAIFKLLWEGESGVLPKTINITVEYLRTATTVDTWARAEFTRHGRRIANVRVSTWQDDVDKPVAIATSHFLLAKD